MYSIEFQLLGSHIERGYNHHSSQVNVRNIGKKARQNQLEGGREPQWQGAEDWRQNVQGDIWIQNQYIHDHLYTLCELRLQFIKGPMLYNAASSHAEIFETAKNNGDMLTSRL
jgi:hypothetical protein